MMIDYVPENWFSFVPVLSNATSGDVRLERQFPTGPTGQTVYPAGRVLRPPNLRQPNAYHVYEEEVPREGTRVLRVVIRSRWVDGSTHLWIIRRKLVGTGEGSSGLRFDQAVPTSLPAGTPPPYRDPASANWASPLLSLMYGPAACDRNLRSADELTQFMNGVALYGFITSTPSMCWEQCFSHAVSTAYVDVARQRHRSRL
jgi:hypothetical protein